MLIKEKTRLGIVYMLAAVFCFALMGFYSRIVSKSIPPVEISLIRSVVGILIIAPYMLKKKINFFGTEYLALSFRGLMGAISAICYFISTATAPLAEAMTLLRSATLYIPFMAWLCLKEKLKLIKVIYAIVGFAGTCLILKPGFLSLQTGILVALLGGFLTAVSWVSIKSLSNREDPMTIIFYFLFFSIPCCIIYDYQNFVIPDLDSLKYLIPISIFGTVGQILMTNAYKHAEATILTPIGYSEVLFLGLLAWSIFGEKPDIISIFGMIIIMLMSIFITAKE